MNRPTCEGCAFLRTLPRPMCISETSAHFRRPRDTYQDRCPSFAVKGRQQQQQGARQ